jgi:hypothetical protein
VCLLTPQSALWGVNRQAGSVKADQLSSQLGREWLRQARPAVPLGKLGCKIKTNGFG